MPAPAAEACPGAQQALGRRVHALRRRAGLTLQELSLRCGLSPAALSKLENGLSSPTYDTLLRLAVGLGVDLPQLFDPAPEPAPGGRRAITRAGLGMRHSSPHYDYEMLCANVSHKAFTPLRTRIRARSVAAFLNGLEGHSGEEFFFVLNGALELHTDQYRPVRLNAGDSAWFDSRMGHALVSVSEADAEILWVATRVYGALQDPAAGGGAQTF